MGGGFAALRQPPARAALVVLGATNLVMVAIMAVTPLLLMAHGHHLGFVGLAVSVHVLGMFAPSVATGWLADRVGGVGGPGGGRDGRASGNGGFEGVTVPEAFSIGRLAALRHHAGVPAAPAR
jgi:MFS family permease